MKKPLNERKGFKILKSVLNGAADALPIVSSIKANIESGEGVAGSGKVDWLRLVTNIALVAGLVYLVKSGVIPVDQVIEIVKSLF